MHHLAVINLLVFFFLVSLLFSHQVLSQYSSPDTDTLMYSSVVKDATTSLHTIKFQPEYNDHTQPGYVIDLDAPFTWQSCTVQLGYPYSDCEMDASCLLYPLSCNYDSCKQARSYDPNPVCPPLNITSKYGCKICAVTTFNPVSNTCKMSELTFYVARFPEVKWDNYTNEVRYGYDYGNNYGRGIYLSCAPSSLLKSLPKNVLGVAAFSWSTLSFPRQFHDIVDKFALCLSSSTSAPGVTLFADRPFYFTPSPKLDIRTILSYTPMIRKSSKSLGYYIKLNRISIKGTPIRLPRLKSERVKLSTIVTYTTLRSDIYKAIVTSFSKATKTIPRVNVVKPFSLCLKSSAVGNINKGFRVPNIELETESGKVWTISGDNSMKRTGNGTACLAFVDGGSRVKDAIVIGTFQMENNFLFFDLKNEELGFSSSLLGRGIPCSSFNYTYVHEK